MAKNYEDMTDKEKAEHDKWTARAAKMEAAGKNTSKIGGAMMGMGCLMTLLITIPIIILLIFIF